MSPTNVSKVYIDSFFSSIAFLAASQRDFEIATFTSVTPVILDLRLQLQTAPCAPTFLFVNLQHRNCLHFLCLCITIASNFGVSFAGSASGAISHHSNSLHMEAYLCIYIVLIADVSLSAPPDLLSVCAEVLSADEDVSAATSCYHKESANAAGANIVRYLFLINPP